MNSNSEQRTVNSEKTVFEVLKSSRAYLEARDIHEARRSCDLLMSFMLKCQPLDLFFRLDYVLSMKLLDAMRRGVKRLAEHEPVQYILGEWGFMQHTFKTDKRALIPRPETEELVQLILECEELWLAEPAFILDIGTGSGCIAICLALAKPNSRYLGIDVSLDALALAQENAVRLKVGDNLAFSDKELSDLIELDTVNAVVANLPYIPTADYEELPSHIKSFEPSLALDGGEDGLDIIRSVAEDASMVLKNNGYIFLEMDHRQGSAISEMLEQLGFYNITVKKDMAGHDRFVVAQMKQE